MNSFIDKAIKKAHRMSEDGLRALVLRLFGEYSLLEAVLDSIADGVAILDENNRIVSINKSLAVMSPSHIEKLGSIADIFDEEVREFVENVIQREERCKDKEFAIEIRGEMRYVELSILPLVKRHRISGTIIIVSDITEKKLAEIKTQRLESLARLSNVAASISHEIKNPLAAISIHIQLLEKTLHSVSLISLPKDDLREKLSTNEKEEEKQREKLEKHVSVIKEEIERLNKIVVDFLFAVRPIKFQVSLLDINLVLSSLLETFCEEAIAKHVKFDTHFSPTPLLLQGDERFLRQAFMNLILNAFHAMQEKGGLLSIKSYGENAKIVVEISDEGEGISPQILAKIFEPYFTTKDSGTGLGLTLTYKVIKEHGGDIQVYSEEGEGTMFKITLPPQNTQGRLLLGCDK